MNLSYSIDMYSISTRFSFFHQFLASAFPDIFLVIIPSKKAVTFFICIAISNERRSFLIFEPFALTFTIVFLPVLASNFVRNLYVFTMSPTTRFFRLCFRLIGALHSDDFISLQTACANTSSFSTTELFWRELNILNKSCRF